MRHCWRCDTDKPLSEFGSDRSRRDGLNPQCRACIRARYHEVISGDPRTHERCREVLLAAGAHLVCEHTPGESVSGDGLIVASFAESDGDLTVLISHAPVGSALFDLPMFNPALRQAE